MGSGLPHPVLISTFLGLDKIIIAGKEIAFMHVFYTWLAMLILIALGLIVRRKLSLVPGRLQNVLEVLIGGLENFTSETMGDKEGKRFFPILCGVFLFILIMNLMGLVPLFEAPTANINTPAAMAVAIFIYYNFVGIKRWHGSYIKQFMGPMPALAPFMMLIEFISHLARLLSLTMRLFGNIFGESMVLALFFGLLPVIATMPVYFLFLMAKTLQAFIFYMLAMIYIKSAVEGAH